MRTSLLVSAGMIALLLSAGAAGLEAQPQFSAAALSGTVTSAEEGPMAGVLVSAKQAGRPVTVTVVTDRQGRYHFPAVDLRPGAYALSIRAAGYRLAHVTAVTVGSARPAAADLRLTKVADLAATLSDAEWAMSVPGTDAQKRALLNCNSCHSLQRIVTSRFTAGEFIPIIQRMRTAYTNNTTPLNPQRRMDARTLPSADSVRPYAEYLASINLSSGKRSYRLKTFPRPVDEAGTVITEYDLPRRIIEPHDVIVDAKGLVWFSDFGENVLGSFDTKTLKESEYKIPVMKPGYPMGGLDLETDASGAIYEAMMHQGGVAKFDPSTKAFTMIPIPPQYNDAATQQSFATAMGADGKEWIKDTGSGRILRYTAATGTWEAFGPFMSPVSGKRIDVYGVNADSKNNGYFMDFTDKGGEFIGRIDAVTGAVTHYRTLSDDSRPRRSRFDAQDRLWIGEYGGNAIGMLDTKTGKMSEWKMPTPWTAPYDVAVDKHGDAWTGSMWNDRVVRLDPRTGRTVEYLLPRSTNIRRLFVDDRGGAPVLWIGDNHGAAIIKLEPGEVARGTASR